MFFLTDCLRFFTSTCSVQLLVAALTTAQARLHDAKSAFQETAGHLELTSKACAATKAQLGSLREELKNARDEVERHRAATQEARDQLAVVQKSQQQLKMTMQQNERAWHQEKVSLELALENLTATHAGRGFAESSENVVTHIKALTNEVARAHDASSTERQSLHERAQTAEDDARTVRDELRRALQDVSQLQAAVAETKEELAAERGAAAVARLEASRASALVESEREKAATAAEKEEAMRTQLSAALTAQTLAVKERNGAESALDQLNVELARAHRRIQALEAQRVG
jgi:chromosome segregation ATPase